MDRLGERIDMFERSTARDTSMEHILYRVTLSPDEKGCLLEQKQGDPLECIDLPTATSPTRCEKNIDAVDVTNESGNATNTPNEEVQDHGKQEKQTNSDKSDKGPASSRPTMVPAKGSEQVKTKLSLLDPFGRKERKMGQERN